jgi:hypothetical protein
MRKHSKYMRYAVLCPHTAYYYVSACIACSAYICVSMRTRGHEVYILRVLILLRYEVHAETEQVYAARLLLSTFWSFRGAMSPHTLLL